MLLYTHLSGLRRCTLTFARRLGSTVVHSLLPNNAVCVTGPFVDIYYSSQFAPLVVFFLLFLAVVKNTKLPHFVRFNCMQGIMIDIVTMLFNILRTYFPAELRWSVILDVRLGFEVKISAACCVVLMPTLIVHGLTLAWCADL